MIALLVLCSVAPRLPAATPAPADSQLDALRQQCIGAALAAQQREQSIGALDLAIHAMQASTEVKNRELVLSREQQEALLGALERLARAPAGTLALTPQDPIDRRRSEILIAAAVPALSAQARSLSNQLAELEKVRGQIDARQKDIDAARDVLAKSRVALAQAVIRRNALIGQMLHDDEKATAVDATASGGQASDLSDLIKKADAATDLHDKELLIRLKALYAAPNKPPPNLADPTKPKTLRSFDAPNAQMVWPVLGELIHRFGETDLNGGPDQGLALQGVDDGVVVAPFDGQVDYIGQFQDYGLILIIRHGGGYHSLLAGLGHVDVTTGQWLLAGEPVGSLPGADDKGTGTTFYFELRRDGRPVDPQPRLGSRDQKSEDTRVHE
ncbi:MAG TPA: peptidoglycan DD-metalloendopeptidase family protein [Stellaceae bacterium]|jgi:septal ring factor EnvC (AmiA/AmiB activator)|nr:peptidoglycan DD-metalloendopeptidase family protein [Stellaceae bacterium]